LGERANKDNQRNMTGDIKTKIDLHDEKVNPQTSFYSVPDGRQEGMPVAELWAWVKGKFLVGGKEKGTLLGGP